MFGSFFSSLALPAGLDYILPAFLFLGVCIGHAALLLFNLNWLYGCALPRGFLRIIRRLYEVIILVSPVLLWFVYGFDVVAGANRSGAPVWHYALLVYACICGTLGLIVLPVLTVGRLLRRAPAALVSNHTHTFDVAEKLGYKPAGHGKYRRLAHLPFNQLFQVDFAERTLCLPQLPDAWDGLTILHLSDLHFCGTPDRIFYEQVIDRCRAWGEHDLVAITGDVIDSDWHHRWIMPLLGRLRWNIGAYAVLGNHDSYRDPPLVRRRLRRIGIHVLGNSWEQVTVRGEPMVIVGNECPWFQPAANLETCPPGVFRLCLSHTPDQIAWARKHEINLMLAGHVHGGQIRFPVIGSVFVPSRYSRRYDCGTFHEPPTVMHVSRGLAGQHPLRFHCRPEVTKLVLRSASRLEKI